MGDARPKKPLEGSGDGAERVLRAKYLDYCSSQVAERLLLLSPDEIYVLAQEEFRGGGRKNEPSYPWTTPFCIAMASSSVSNEIRYRIGPKVSVCTTSQ